jgi:putative ATP-dependent endonuclease of OLD family
MSILIDTVRIAGFRGIENIEISLPRVTVLIGTNNSGKTSVIKALQLALGDYSRYLTDEDFHIDSSDVRCDQILVDVRIIPIDVVGARTQTFTDDWAQEFGDKIQAEANGEQFLAMRTVGKPDTVKGGFTVEHFALDQWPAISSWQDEETRKKQQVRRRYDALPFISIDAQRDIHQELTEKSSFVGKVLSSIKYNESDVKKLEEMVAQINQEAVDKSEPLKELKKHLDTLNQSFNGTGKTELTPFPKRIRDLSKRFSVSYGESAANSFSMEYHGMGTRSWASMLTVKALIDLMAKTHEEEVIPFFPILAVEEPEAHLHPNAQRTLYQQLISTTGQIIISTHSPYLAAMSDLQDMRGLVKDSNGSVSSASLISGLDQEDINSLQREIMRFRGEILFAKALILFEGVTEEQLVPAMFQQYCGKSAFSIGVNCISVAGKNYPPFVKFACSFGIPVCIVSDNDGNTKQEIESQVDKIRGEGLALDSNIFSLNFISEDNDIEAELINTLNMQSEIVEALVATETRGSTNEQYVVAKTTEIESLNDEELLEKMRKSKASYAGFLSDVILRNPNGKRKEELVPEAMIAAFTQIERWLES